MMSIETTKTRTYTLAKITFNKEEKLRRGKRERRKKRETEPPSRSVSTKILSGSDSTQELELNITMLSWRS